MFLVAQCNCHELCIGCTPKRSWFTRARIPMQIRKLHIQTYWLYVINEWIFSTHSQSLVHRRLKLQKLQLLCLDDRKSFEVLVVSHNGISSTKLPMTLNLTSLFTKCSHHGTPITPISVGLSFEVTRCFDLSFSSFFNQEQASSSSSSSFTK